MVLGERTRIVVPFDNPLDYPWRRFVAAGLHAARPRGRGARVRRREPRARPALGRAVGARRGAADERRRCAAAPRARRCCARRSRCWPARTRGSSTRARWSSSARRSRRGNQRSEARDLLREGVELAHRAGAPALVERGNEELAATGARPRKLVVSGARLADRERAPRRRAGRAGPQQQGDRAGALRHREDRRGAPLERLPQAPDHLAPPARAGARQRRAGEPSRDGDRRTPRGSRRVRRPLRPRNGCFAGYFSLRPTGCRPLGSPTRNLGVAVWGSPQCEHTPSASHAPPVTWRARTRRRREMIVAGQTVENPQTGERLVFSKTARETGGEYTAVRGVHRARRSPAGGAHPSRPERAVRDHVGHADAEDRRAARSRPSPATSSRSSPARRTTSGTRPTKRSASRSRSGRRSKIESVIETMYGLAADGKTNRFGMPNPLRLAVIAKAPLRHRAAAVRRRSRCSAPRSPSAPRSAACSASAATYTRTPATDPVPAFAGRRPALAVA